MPQTNSRPESSSVLDASPIAVRVEHLSKSFPGQLALNDLDFDLRCGEIHALCGQNGSGKSTLIKILSGFHRPDPGSRTWLGSEAVELGSLSLEQQARMLFIHQDLALVPTLSVIENLSLEPHRAGRALMPVDRRTERADARRLLSTFDLDIDPNSIVGELNPFEQSAVAIVRAFGSVGDDALLLVLDEPTATLGANEVQQLFGTLRDIRDRGIGVLYVSHILPEVLDIADRISVLRDGRRVAVCEAAGTSEEDLVQMIVGRSVKLASPPEREADRESALLQVEGLSSAGLDPSSFSVRGGEIVGLTGLLGSGWERIAECLAGSRAIKGGVVTIDGQSFDSLTPAEAHAAGMAAMPADRRRAGLLMAFSILENITLPRAGVAWRRGRIDGRAEREDVQHWLGVCEVVPPEPSKLVQELSGGNQQKVMLAKALRLQPKVLVLAEPTQAVDVGASAAIRNLITQLAEEGRAILVASSDPEELQQLCHRVLVTRGGRIAVELVGDEITEDRLMFESHFEGTA